MCNMTSRSFRTNYIYIVSISTLMSCQYMWEGNNKTISNAHFGDTVINKCMNINLTKDFINILA